MKSGRKNSFTDLNNMNKCALFKVAHFQTKENQKLTTFAEKRPLLRKK